MINIIDAIINNSEWTKKCVMNRDDKIITNGKKGSLNSIQGSDTCKITLIYEGFKGDETLPDLDYY